MLFLIKHLYGNRITITNTLKKTFARQYQSISKHHLELHLIIHQDAHH